MNDGDTIRSLLPNVLTYSDLSKWRMEGHVFFWGLLLLMGILNVDGETVASNSQLSTSKDKIKAIQLPPCQACRALIASFQKGMEKTSRGKFEGGDAAWEEEKLGSYAGSEVRLVEIQEKLCSDVLRGQDQCHTLAEETEQLIEDWWFSKQTEEPYLFTFLCIKSLKHCCPDDHYGPECKPCPGYPDNICNKSGKCKGAGTRKGSGKCACNPGYESEFCNQCDTEYYESYRDADKLLCSTCHSSCQGACSQAGPRGCVACKSGWVMDTEKGCLDVNECFEGNSVCNKNQFCVNNEGSFSCLECDKSCESCHADGPDMCNKCSKGYTLKDNVCVDDGDSSRDTKVYLTRYLTYAGLCVATCIIFQKNPIVASLVGLAVALYIYVSEYVLSTNRAPLTLEDEKLKNLFDLLG